MLEHYSKDKCDFPKGMKAIDRIKYLAAKPEGFLAVNTHANRGHNTGMYNPVIAAPDGALGSEDAKCYGQFHRPKDKKPYWKPDRLVLELKKLFNEIPVVNPVEALKRLAVMKDTTDGGLLFCYSKRGEIRKY